MPRRFITAVALCALIVINCPAMAEDAPAPDPATPKGAAHAFFKAMEKGDAAGAKAMATGTEKQLAILDVLTPVVSSFKQLEAAAVKKWGEDGRKALASGPGGGGMDFADELKNAKEEINGDSATIVSAKEPKKDPMKLKKVDGKWKLDMASIPAEQFDDPNNKKMITAMADVAKSTAAEIEAGKYADANAAKQAMGQKIIALIGGGGLGGPVAPPEQPKK